MSEIDKLDAMIEKALPLLSTEARKALTFTRWKDGIDIDYVTVDARQFVRALLTAALKPEDALDAKRYRWLRDTPWSDDLHRVITLHQNALFDTAIDAAMKEPNA